MNVVDACSWLEYFAGGEQAEFFAPALGDTERLVVPTIGLLEVFKRVAQRRDERHYTIVIYFMLPTIST